MSCLLPALGSLLKSSLRDDLPGLCDEYHLPPADYEDSFTKQQYVETRLQKITDNDHLRMVAIHYARQHPLRLDTGRPTYRIEEILWQDDDIPPAPLWIRRVLVDVFARADLDRESLIRALGRAFVFDAEPSFALFRRDSRSPLQQIREDYPKRLEPRQAEDIIEEVGAFACGTLRFCRLIEVFVASDALPTETTDRLFAASQSALKYTGYRITKIARADDGVPTVSLDKVSDPKSKRYRRKARLEIANEYRTLVTYGLVFPSLGVYFFLWLGLSIANAIWQTHHVVALLPLPLVVCGLLFLRWTVKELRWLWLIALITSVLSLAVSAHGWINHPSQPMWGFLTACAIAGVIKAMCKGKRETQSPETAPPPSSLREAPPLAKLAALLWATTFASMGVALFLFATAELLGVWWEPISSVRLTFSPPYILIR